MLKKKFQLKSPLLPSQATIFTLSTLANSCTSRNSTSLSMRVQTLSQKRYVFSLLALNVTRALTRWLRALFMDLSNCSRTLKAKAGVICPYWSWRNKENFKLLCREWNHMFATDLPVLIHPDFLAVCCPM